MARFISQREFRNAIAEVMDAVAAGESFIVTRYGEPVAELRPVQAARKTFISRQDLTHNSSVHVGIDPHQFRRDLDNAVDQGL